ncbi:hypothetical protein BWQ96_00696 [Gracilariopsis chorda]|uniref:RAB6-interacting golgin n=1 Tax=Gracilariopsis chorda TaxID=448386 RepID=A0A2V3J8D5_9FLOR|nr:hypothetical protein BWQ96_00696 [Gracilariopsis chorda]|eukprot:PXF49380.1 hypothetical protein BWQ96_00696 [Gracilariopsis chorda]
MSSSEFSSSDAAELVLKERQRQRSLHANTAPDPRSPNNPNNALSKPKLETVSTPQWGNTPSSEHSVLDEADLDRRHRALQQKLERKQQDIQRQGKRLQKVRDELKALEVPIRAEIMNIRQQLEQANREEITLVDTVNALRNDLYNREQQLTQVRATKQHMADNLIKVMADYEKRKAERLNQIAELVADEEGANKPPPPSKSKPSSTSKFLGFS